LVKACCNAQKIGPYTYNGEVEMDLCIDCDNDFSFIDHLPVAQSYYNGLLRYHAPPGDDGSGCSTLMFAGTVFVPFFSLGNAAGVPTSTTCFVRESPWICVTFGGRDENEIDVATSLGIGMAVHCQDIGDRKVSWRVIRSPAMHKRRVKMPPPAYIAESAKAITFTGGVVYLHNSVDRVGSVLIRFARYVSPFEVPIV
jgi:hypothetical protein